MNRSGFLRTLGLIAALALAPVAQAAPDDVAQRAARASFALRDAADALAAARQADDRTSALAQTIRAYETGLAAMRDALRATAVRERALRLQFASRQRQMADLLAALQTIERSPRPLFLVHPQGPVGAARAAMILGDIAPELARRADALRKELGDFQVLLAIRTAATDDLEQGLAGAQQARVALAEAVSRRTDLPRRFAADPARIRDLLESSDTLEGFASGLAQSVDGAADTAPQAQSLDLSAPANQFRAPVRGTLLRRYLERDAAGVQRPGIILAAPALSLVTAPATATVRYAGPLLDYGNVMILEPSSDTLIVLAGLSQVYGEVGQIMPAGDPVGLLTGQVTSSSDFLIEAGQGASTTTQETLYIEVRQNGQAVDPEPWFALQDR